VVPIITGSVASDTDTPTIEPTLLIDFMSWESSTNSGFTDISPPTDAAKTPTNSSEAFDIEGDSSDDEGDPALPDDTPKEFQRAEPRGHRVCPTCAWRHRHMT
jgi:hypothetical protein